jgi:guanine deaminase
VTIYLAKAFDTPEDPFRGGTLRAEESLALRVVDGVIADRGTLAGVLTRAEPLDDELIDLRDGLLLPGLVDTHVHYPQVRAIGALGMPLLEWLETCALPEEQKLAEDSYAHAVAAEFCFGLLSAGTTTALVFGSHYASAVEALFQEADRVGLRVTSGLVLSDRLLPEPLLTTPERAYEESVALADHWHGRRRTRYAVTPRFSLSASEPILEASAAVMAEIPTVLFTSHVNENLAEVAEVARLFPRSSGYVDTYDRAGLLGPRSVLAHNVHAPEVELKVLAERDTAVAHCPTSNAALGSGLFPLAGHVDAGVRVALGSDVGAGTGFSLLKEGLQAYFVQRLLADAGVPLTPAHLLWLATSAGASALGLAHQVGDFSIGKQFDAVLIRPRLGDPLDVCLRNTATPEEALGRVFALGTVSDVAGVWIGGGQVSGAIRSPRPPLPR